MGWGGRLVAHLETSETDLLVFLLDELLSLVSPTPVGQAEDFFAHLQAQWDAPPVPVSTDPATSRLFPDAFPDDEQASADFRRFTEQNLRITRTARVEVLRRTLAASAGDISLAVDEGHEVLQVLTDLRLVLGTRIGIRDDADHVGEGGVALDVYHWLTWLQESLVQAMFQLPARD